VVSKRKYVLIGSLVSVLILAGTCKVMDSSKRRTVTIEVSGSPGLKVEGTCEVDGTPGDLSGVVPLRFVREAHRLTYSIRSGGEPGELGVKVKVYIDGAFRASAGGRTGPVGVRGWVKSGLFSDKYWIQTFDANSKTEWMAPPP